MNMARNGHSATLLPNGNVLIAGGITAAFTITSTTELYVPVIGAIGTSIANSTKLPNGTFQIVFPYFPLSTNTVVATGELGLISSNWAVLGAAPEFSPGIFLFTDIQTTTNKQRFYRVRSP